MTINVHVLEDFDGQTLAVLRAGLDSSLNLTSGAELPIDVHILVGRRPTREQLAASPDLRAVIAPWAGIPESTQELLRGSPPMTLHNLQHNAAATAEMAITLLLATAKFIVPLF